MSNTTVKHDPDTVLSMLEEMEKMLEIRKRAKALGAPRTSAQRAKKPSVSRPAHRSRAKRVGLKAKVLIVKNQRYVKGHSLNISRSGIFVVAQEKIFEEHEAVRVIIRPIGSSRAFKVIARVARFEDRLGRPRGYGLRFVTAPR